MTIHTTITTPLGDVVLTGDGSALTGLGFAGDSPLPGTRDDAALAEPARQIREYFAGERTEFDLPLAPAGTAFDREVWAELANVGYGETISYGELADRLGRPGSARAVGAANGRNPIALVVPCHRVIGAQGALTGYAYGVDRKRALLELEGVLPAPLAA
jgi:methylated-DNA-[protein]-cysteine S-methyltransferase